MKFSTITCLFIILCFSVHHKTSYAEYLLDEQLPAKSVEDIEGSLKHLTEQKSPRIALFPRLRNRLSESSFWRDSHVSSNFRSYYFDRDRPVSKDSEAWAAGGSLNYQSGWLKDHIQIGATVYTSQKVHAHKDKDGTLLLKENQQGLTTLGELYLRAKLPKDIEIKAYRQTLSLPYLNKHDNRMIPNTFEAYLLGQRDTDLEWVAAYVDKMKKKNSTDFVSMTDAAGITEKDYGLFFLAGRYDITENTDFGVINFYTKDYLNTLYSEVNHIFKTEIPVHVSLQATKQQSVGNAFSGNIESYHIGGKASFSYRYLVFTMAATSTGDNDGIRKPFGGTPSYTSLMIADFDRAGEDAWLLGMSYHFDRFGLEGLSAFTNYASGNTPETGSAASNDQQEWDVTIDYKPQNQLNGLWLRLRKSDLKRDGGEDTTDFRVILNYEMQFL